MNVVGSPRWLRLPGLGHVPAVSARDLRAGDEVVWGRGSRTPVVSVAAGEGVLVVEFSGPLMTVFARTVNPDELLAGMRGGRWLGLPVPVSGVRLVCQVSVQRRGLLAPCGRFVALDVGRCGGGHFPDYDQAVFEPVKPAWSDKTA